MSALVHLEVDRGIATITLDSPDNRNALSATLVDQLAGHLAAAARDDTVRGIVLTATGSVFCAGADLKNPPGSGAGGGGATLPDILTSILECPKVVVARLNGHVRAGGTGLVAACDVVVAPDDITFAFTEVRIGVSPAVISVVCRRVMDRRSLHRYLLIGETFDAAAAAEAGLVTIVCHRDELDAAVASVADGVRATAPNAVARTKALLGELEALDLADAFAHAAVVSAELFGSDEGREGIASFREKRPPAWVAALAPAEGDDGQTGGVAAETGTATGTAADTAGGGASGEETQR
jgi:enoyl-CoA hydratase/carnithine racemase